jgi:hypothetical protein
MSRWDLELIDASRSASVEKGGAPLALERFTARQMNFAHHSGERDDGYGVRIDIK